MDLRWNILYGYMPLFASALLTTIKITIVALIGGMVLGLVFGLIRSTSTSPRPKSTVWRWALPPLRWFATAYITFFRGTPLFVQILLVHFALMPTLIQPEHGLLLSGPAAIEFRQNYGAFFSGALALTLNSGAYVSEIFRAGIQSIYMGQTQAAWSLGFTPVQTMRYIIVPQATRRMIPPLVNEAITLLKDSSLVSAIGLAELALAARTVAGAYARYWEPYLFISALYLLMTMALTLVAQRLENPGYKQGR